MAYSHIDYPCGPDTKFNNFIHIDAVGFGKYEAYEKIPPMVYSKAKKGYFLFQLYQGSARVTTEHKTFNIESRTILCLDASVPFEIEFISSSEETIFYQILFSGKIATIILSQTRLLEEDICFMGNFSAFPEITALLYNLIKNRTENSELSTIGRLFSLVIMLYECKYITFKERRSKKYKVLVPVLRHMEEHFNTHLSVKEYADMCNLNPSYFQEIFKEYTTHSPHDYINRVRVYNSNVLISNTSLSIEEIAKRIGFKSSSAFVRFYKNRLKISPLKQRLKGLSPLPADSAALSDNTHNRLNSLKDTYPGQSNSFMFKADRPALTFEKPIQNYFEVLSNGITFDISPRHYSFSFNAVSGILIFYVHSGNCMIKINSIIYSLSQNEVLVFKIDATSNVQITTLAPSVFFYGNFTGDFVREVYDKNYSKNIKYKINKEFNLMEHFSLISRYSLYQRSGSPVLICFEHFVMAINKISINGLKNHTTLSQKYNPVLSVIKDINSNCFAIKTIGEYAADNYMSRERFSALFKGYTGYSPTKYIKIVQEDKINELLTETDMPIKKIAELCGYMNQHTFEKAYKKKHGMLPEHYRKKEKMNESI